MKQDKRIYKQVFLLLVFFVAVFAVLAVLPSAAPVILIALVVWSLIGPEQALMALSLSAVIKYLNPAIYTFPGDTTILFFLVMFVASARCLMTMNLVKLRFVAPLICFYLVVLALSAYSSANAEVSMMKVTFFTLMSSAILTATYRQKEKIVRRWQLWFLSLSMAVILLSLLTFLSPHIAYFRNGQGFQGIFNHPQVLGPWSAVLAAWILFYLLRAKRLKGHFLPVAALLLLLALVIASKARTGMVTFLLSVVFVYFASVTSRRNFGITLSKGGAFLAGFMLIAGIVLTYSEFSKDIMNSYIHKHGGDGASVVDSFSHTRGATAKSQWRNFLSRPLTGYGFGVYADGHFRGGIVRYHGIAISAPVEKGVLFTSIFEEIGLIGVAFFLWFFIKILKGIYIKADPKWLAMFLACVFLNIGEAVFFSVGGIGLYYWCLMGLCVASTTYSSRSRGS